MSNERNMIVPGVEFEQDRKTYVTTGEWRPPKKSEWWLNDDYFPQQSHHNWTTPQIILRELPPPPPPRRVPTDADALHRPKCWFRDSKHDRWSKCSFTLVAVVDGAEFPFYAVNEKGIIHIARYCEIEDAPIGPLYHWRDATEADVGKWVQLIELPSGEYTNMVIGKFQPGTKVLVEVGK